MIYRAGDGLRPHQIRAATFRARWRGLDPDQVYAYLRQVADELDRLLRETTTARTEAERIRQGLRQWQSHHTGCGSAQPSPESKRMAANQDQPPRNGGRW